MYITQFISQPFLWLHTDVSFDISADSSHALDASSSAFAVNQHTNKNVLANVACLVCCHADISGAVKSVDDSIAVMQNLFAPFPETMFPRALDTTSLAGLLGAPLACRVPLTQSQYQHANRLFPDLFCPETSISAHDLHPTLITALQASWPTGSPTELLLTPFWDTVGYKLPEFAAGHLGIAVSENRLVVVSLWCPSCS